MAQLSQIPEFVLCTMINNALNFIRTDYNNQSDKTKSLLCIMTTGPSIERIDFFNSMVDILIKKNTDARFLEAELMFNMKSESPPNIYISLPSEQPGQNGIGNDEGYEPGYVVEDPTTHQGTYQAVFTRRKNVTYNLVITSDNSNETIVIYHFIYALLLSLSNTLALGPGFQNQRVSGGEVRPYAELVPKNIFTRVVSLYFEYEVSTVDFSQYPLINQALFKGAVLDTVTI